jgi:TPR repeat protein
LLFLKGQGVLQNPTEAFMWFKRAAEQGEGIAQTNLGLLYIKGQGVAQDLRQSAYWFNLAACKGIPSSQVNLGFMYECGRGVPQDYVSAHMWYSLGMERGHTRAMKHRDLIEKKMLPVQIEKAQQLAKEWLAEHRG